MLGSIKGKALISESDLNQLRRLQFGRKLRGFRQSADFTAKALAEAVTTEDEPVTQNDIYTIEHGRTHASESLLNRIADVLQVDLEVIRASGNETWDVTGQAATAFQDGLAFAWSDILVCEASKVGRFVDVLATELGLECELSEKAAQFLEQMTQVIVFLRQLRDTKFCQRAMVHSPEMRLLEKELVLTFEILSTVRQEFSAAIGDNNSDLSIVYRKAHRSLATEAKVLNQTIESARAALHVLPESILAESLDRKASGGVNFPSTSLEPSIGELIEKLKSVADDVEQLVDCQDARSKRQLNDLAWEACDLSQRLAIGINALGLNHNRDHFDQVAASIKTVAHVLKQTSSTFVDSTFGSFMAKPSTDDFRLRTAIGHMGVRADALGVLAAKMSPNG